MSKHVKVDGKVRTDPCFPAGFMDVVEIEASSDKFRLLYDTKGRFRLHRISDTEKAYKLCRVQAVYITAKKIPVLTTHDGRTIRYPPPAVKVHDVVKVDLESGKIVDSIKFDVGMTCMITKGRNTGRVGTIVNIEKHPGSFDIVAVRDASNHQFATRLSNIFVVGKDDDLQVSLPKGKGVKLSILEERKKPVWLPPPSARWWGRFSNFGSKPRRASQKLGRGHAACVSREPHERRKFEVYRVALN